MKTCRTCIHMRPARDWIFRFTSSRYRFAKCARTEKTTTDPVSGEKTTELTYCSIERDALFGTMVPNRNYCGIDAKHWEGKTE